jgi:4'-phosphopantetheinyl transferase
MAQRHGLSESDIHVFCVDLDRAGDGFPALYSLLSPDERERAARFRFEKHRSRFVVARARLRELIGDYAGCHPQAVEFTYGPNGKPGLGDRPLHFNVSHSEALALYAFSRSNPLGVDIEQIRELTDSDAIADRFFSRAECAEYRAVAPTEKTAAFFRCWTRKEAFIKATGDGLSYPLDRFDVSLGDPARLLTIDGDAARASEWSMYHLTPAEGYIGAVAVQGRGFRVIVIS